MLLYKLNASLFQSGAPRGSSEPETGPESYKMTPLIGFKFLKMISLVAQSSQNLSVGQLLVKNSREKDFSWRN